MDYDSGMGLGRAGLTQSLVMPDTEPRLNPALSRSWKKWVIKHSGQHLTYIISQ